ncbi:MAG: CPBP family intramembrane metalloprotease [Deltaproteobacteria bacterium]|nr:CPBP family intramembrane metalloprotease [Deltaproteobacteria bacterium]
MTRLVWLIYRKEVLETLRDKRTLIVMVLLPLCLYPLVGVGVTQWMGVQQAARRAQPSRVGLAGPAWPELDVALAHDPQLRLVRPAQREAVSRGELDLVLDVRGEHGVALASGRPVSLELVFDETREASTQALRRAKKALEGFGRALARDRLERAGLSPSLLEPLAVRERGLASQKQIGRKILSTLIPMLVVLMVLLGAFYPAIDLTAGEKERGTLETLLVAPVPRLALIVGKCLVVATVALVTGLLNMGSIGVTFGLGFAPALKASGLLAELPWSSVALTVVALVPAALFYAAVMVAVATLARSFKEAQTLLTPVYLVCVLPTAVSQLPGVELTPLTALLPAVNVALLTRELVAGKLAWLPTLLAVGSTLAYALAALSIGARIYQGERLLFAAEADAGGASGRGARPLAAFPEPWHAGTLLLGVMALMLLVGRPLQAWGIIPGLLVTEWLLIATPVVLLIRFARLDPRAVLALRRPSAGALVGAILAGASGWYLVGVLVEAAQQRVLPIPKEILDEARRLLFDPHRSLALDLFALALSPAICEELLFRGVLLRASQRGMKTGAIVLLNAALFGLFHLSIYRLLSTAILGGVLAWIVLRGRSIVLSMTFHVLNNSAALLLGRAMGGKELERLEASPVFLGLAAAAFGAGLWLIHRATPAREDPLGR